MPLICVGYNVPLVPQSTDMSCWAAGIAMIYGWRNSLSINPKTIATNAGGISYLDQFKDRTGGLNPNDTYILKRWGLVSEAPQCYTVEGFADLLQSYGPLWVASAVPGPHIRVVTGIDTDEDGRDGIVAINDPWEVGMTTFRPSNRGSTYTRTYSRFMGEVENLGSQELKEPAPVYVAHLT